MSPTLIFGLTAAIVFGMTLFGVLVSRHLLRQLLALNVMGTSVLLIFVAMAHRPEGAPDPVPHAMVLTGIVVAVAATGLAISLLRRSVAETGQVALPESQDRQQPPSPDRRG